MLIRFSSIATESITMFGDAAKQLIKMLGASDTVPNAISAEDVSDALKRLRQQLQLHAAANSEPAANQNDEDKKDYEPPIALASRAGPLIGILERAAAAKAAVIWEKV